MERVITHGQRTGSVAIPSSKSRAHRLLICSALGKDTTEIMCRGMSDDIKATIDCLNSLGAKISVEGNRISVAPIENVPEKECDLYCRESGSTLRFLLPLAGALGADAVFHMEGRLPDRPIEPLAGLLRRHGMTIKKEGSLLRCSGRLSGGSFEIAGDVSSQYISGLLMALPLIGCDSVLSVTGKIESAGYIDMTEVVLSEGKISYSRRGNVYEINGNQRYGFKSSMQAEGDWSNAAFFLCAGAISDQGITVSGLDPASVQGDKKTVDILRRFGAQVSVSESGILVKKDKLHGIVIDASSIPDLIPVLSVVAAVAEGETDIINAARLRLKESDRLASTAEMLRSLGGDVRETDDGLVINGLARLRGGNADSFSDHRIAMSAAVAACASDSDVTISDSECVKKSYPDFYKDFDSLQEVGW